MPARQNPKFKLEPLDKKKHDRAAFSCEEEPLNKYIRERANQEIEKKVAAVYVMSPDGKAIAGYYTLSQYSIDTGELPDTVTQKLRLPRYKMLPTTLLGRLARDGHFKGYGLGELLLMSALSTALEHSRNVASCAVVVDAKIQKASAFYASFGFIPLQGHPNRLFLPMQTIEKMFSESFMEAPNKDSPRSSSSK